MAQLLDLGPGKQAPVLVLDRPNPINATMVSGPVLEAALRSRFGVYPVPLIYGLTIGELALFSTRFSVWVQILPSSVWKDIRAAFWRSKTLVCTSNRLPDHIPEPDSPLFYAVTGFLGEMGVFSTGVGTNRPFHYVLAPWIDGELLLRDSKDIN